MFVLAYISIGLLLYQFLSACLNIIFWERPRKSYGKANELVSVLIPARNEEDNIANILGDLHKINDVILEVIVLDDDSYDSTTDVIEPLLQLDKRIRLISSKGLKDGWLGKNYACYQLARHARGRYLLFIDADVRVSGSVIKDILFFAKEKRLALVSIFPTQNMKTWGEKITVPLMNYILLSLLPLIFVRKSPFSSHSAANGQFMFFDAQIYNKLQPHKMFRNSAVEDISIARYYKAQKEKIACLVGNNDICCKMYPNYNTAVNGFAKNVIMFFGNSFVLSILFGVVNTFGFISVYFLGLKVLMAYLLIFIVTRMIISIISRQSVLGNLFFMVPQNLTLLYIIYKGVVQKHKKFYLWKGREIY